MRKYIDRFLIWMARRTHYVQDLETSVQIMSKALNQYVSGNMDGRHATNALNHWGKIHVRYSSKASGK